MNIKPINNKISHHYFTSAPKMNPNEEKMKFGIVQPTTGFPLAINKIG